MSTQFYSSWNHITLKIQYFLGKRKKTYSTIITIARQYKFDHKSTAANLDVKTATRKKTLSCLDVKNLYPKKTVLFLDVKNSYPKENVITRRFFAISWDYEVNS